MVIWDLIDYLEVPLLLEGLNKKFYTKINFLEYAKITSIIKEHLDWKNIPDYKVPTKEFLSKHNSM